MDVAVSTGLAVLAVGLFGLALYALAMDSLAVSGVCFLSASIVIYIRETRADGDE